MEIREVSERDGAAVAALFLENSLEAGTGFVLDRTPDFSALLRLRGEFRTFGVWHRGRLIGSASALWDMRRVGGDTSCVGEVVDLRVSAASRGGPAARLLLEAVRKTLTGVGASRVVCLIGDGNDAARRLVAGKGGLPELDPLTRYVSVHYVPWGAGRSREGTVRPAGDLDVEQVMFVYAKAREGMELLPCEVPTWPDRAGRHRAWLATTPDGRVIGGLVVWDGQELRRIRVTRYRGWDRALRAATSLAARVGQATALPAPGGALRTWASRAFWTDPNRPAVVRALMREALREAARSGVHVLQINLHSESPLLELLPAFPRSTYRSTLYGMTMKSGAHRPLDPQMPASYDLALV